MHKLRLACAFIAFAVGASESLIVSMAQTNSQGLPVSPGALKTTLSWTPNTCPKSTDPEEPWCLPGESVVGVQQAVPAVPSAASTDNPPCLGDVDAGVSRLLHQAGMVASKNPYPMAGSELITWLSKNTSLDGLSGELLRNTERLNKSNCVTLLVAVPVQRMITRVQMTLASDNVVPGGCGILDVKGGVIQSQKDFFRCGVYQSWLARNPGRVNAPTVLAYAGWKRPQIDNNVVAAVFANWSTTSLRTPYLRVYYK